MKDISIITEIVRKYPVRVFLNVLANLAISFFLVCSFITLAPIIDLYIHPDGVDMSALSLKVFSLLGIIGIEASLRSCMLMFMVVVIFTTFTIILARYFVIKTRTKIVEDIMTDTFRVFFSAKWSFFSRNKQAVFLNIFNQEYNSLNSSLHAMTMIFASILQVFFPLVIPFYISWQVTLICFLASLVLAFPFLFLGRITSRLGQKRVESANSMISFIMQNIVFAKVVLGFGNQQESIKKVSEIYRRHLSIVLKTQLINLSVPVLFYPFIACLIFIALFAGTHYKVPLSEMGVILLAIRQVGTTIGVVLTQKSVLDSLAPSYRQIRHFQEEAIQEKQNYGERRFDTFQDRIQIQDVRFSYDDKIDVFRGLNLTIKRGQMVALVGKSGAGKSTLIDLIMAFCEPQAGKVLIDGEWINNYDLISYRKRLGYVPQDSALFNMSIRDNLLWSYPQATDEDITEACRLAYVNEFVNELPLKFDTVVGDRGVRLSGGQIQRIALARALLRQPEILILDEATSSLDTQSEFYIQKAIEGLSHRTTVIVIAHRLSTIKQSDMIYVLDEGNIVEQGKYEALMTKNGYFTKMVKLQELSVAA